MILGQKADESLQVQFHLIKISLYPSLFWFFKLKHFHFFFPKILQLPLLFNFLFVISLDCLLRLKLNYFLLDQLLQDAFHYFIWVDILKI